ncbi:EF hand family protein [Brugia pahangi]
MQYLVGMNGIGGRGRCCDSRPSQRHIVLNRSTQLVLCPWCSLDEHELQQYHRQFTPTRMGICCSSNSRSRNTQQNASNKELKEEDLRGIFKEFDLNGDGYIQKDELNAVMVKMGQCPTDDELNAMFDAADKDKDGNIDFDEFLSIAYANPLSLSLKAVFDELDVDGDGCITRSELRTAFQRMGHNLTDSDIKAIYNQVDVNRDGKINFDEFCQMMTRKKG